MRNLPVKIVAALFLLLSMPLLLMVGSLIQIKYPGSFFYKQIREGKHGNHFYIWKLRTMVSNANAVLETLLANNILLKKEWIEFGCLKKDPRIAGTFGRLSRACSIDEIPQMWNIIKGEMAFIGPRPLEPFLAESLDLPFRQLRNSVLPGISGLWQVHFRSEISICQMQLYDKLYLRKKSFCLNLYIIFKTIKAVITGTGN